MPNKIVIMVMGHVCKGSQGNLPVRLYNEPGKTPMATFTVVAFKNQRKGDGQYEDVAFFFRCKVWGKRAEWCSKYLDAKTAVLIFGEPEKEEYFDRNTGEKVTSESLIVSSVDFAGSKSDSQQQSQDSGEPFDVEAELDEPLDMNDEVELEFMETPGD